MRTTFRILILPLLLLLCVACGKSGETVEIISQTTEGGDTTVQTTQLEYLELNLPARNYLVPSGTPSVAGATLPLPYP